MDQLKFPEYVYGGLPKLDTFTIVNKRFTLSVLMNIGFTIMFTGILFTHYNKCLMSSVEKPEDPYIHLSSFLIGYLISQIPAAWVSLKFSPLKWFGRSILAYSILVFVFALFSSVGYIFLIILKFFEGVLAGTVFIVFHAAWKNWTPAVERSTLMTFALTGGYLGELFGTFMTMHCSKLPFWMLFSCIIGIFGIIWWFAWEGMVYEAPNKHRTISDEEYNQIHPKIQEEIRPTEGVPCKQIIFSTPFLVLLLVHIVRSWNSRHLAYPVEHLIIISFIKLISFPVGGYLADVLVKKTTFTITYVRKLFISGVCFLEFIYFLTYHTSLNAEIWFQLITFLMQILYYICFSAASINAVDLAPSHAGVTVAIINIISHVIFTYGFKIEFYLSETNWYTAINFISIIAHLVVGVLYAIYGSATPITAK